MRASYRAWDMYLKKSEKKVKKNRYRNNYTPHMAEGLSDSFWMPVPVLPSIGLIDTMNLAILMDFQRRYHPQAEEKDGGWFPCSIQDLIYANGEVVTGPGKQTRFLNKLEKAGFIKRKVLGKPPRRYLWINFDKFAEEHMARILEIEDKEKHT